jgi:hypothetical protein
MSLTIPASQMNGKKSDVKKTEHAPRSYGLGTPETAKIKPLALDWDEKFGSFSASNAVHLFVRDSRFNSTRKALLNAFQLEDPKDKMPPDLTPEEQSEWLEKEARAQLNKDRGLAEEWPTARKFLVKYDKGIREKHTNVKQIRLQQPMPRRCPNRPYMISSADFVVYHTEQPLRRTIGPKNVQEYYRGTAGVQCKFKSNGGRVPGHRPSCKWVPSDAKPCGCPLPVEYIDQLQWELHCYEDWYGEFLVIADTHGDLVVYFVGRRADWFLTFLVPVVDRYYYRYLRWYWTEDRTVAATQPLRNFFDEVGIDTEMQELVFARRPKDVRSIHTLKQMPELGNDTGYGIHRQSELDDEINRQSVENPEGSVVLELEQMLGDQLYILYDEVGLPRELISVIAGYACTSAMRELIADLYLRTIEPWKSQFLIDGFPHRIVAVALVWQNEFLWTRWCLYHFLCKPAYRIRGPSFGSIPSRLWITSIHPTQIGTAVKESVLFGQMAAQLDPPASSRLMVHLRAGALRPAHSVDLVPAS